MKTLMQTKFTLEMAKHIVAYLYPEFSDIIDDFNFNIENKYTWVTIEAKKPEFKLGIDNRTKKEKKNPYEFPDTREIIEEAYKIDMGLSNHNSKGLWGSRVKKQHIQNAIDKGDIYFRVWNFVYSYGAGKEFSEEQQEYVLNYLKENNIGLPSVEEFYTHYYKN